MDWYKTIFELIDLRSFSNLWYWIALAVLWSSASHWVLGVPFDLVTRARRQGGQPAADLETLVMINARRLLFIARVSGLWLIGIVAFILTTLIVLGFWYGIEFAQAVFLLAAPMTVVSLLALSAARAIEHTQASGADLYKRLSRLRMKIQGLGMVSILITSMWGMWQNMNLGAL